MSIIHGKGTTVLLYSATAESAIPLSPVIDKVEIPWDYDEAETTTFGASGKTFIPGLYESVITISGKFDTAASSAAGDIFIRRLHGVSGTSIKVTPSGGQTWSAVGFTKSYKIGLPVNDKVDFTLAFRVSGAISVA